MEELSLKKRFLNQLQGKEVDKTPVGSYNNLWRSRFYEEMRL